MKSKLCLLFLTITSFTVYFGSSTSGQTRDKSVLSPGPVRPGGLDYRAELPQGYLKVYSATDKFDDGGVQYYAHSSYAIYTINGKLLKNVENHISRSDEIPEIVSLPVGSYTVIARSERDGYVRVSVVIKEGQRTILDLDLGQRRLSSGYHTINRSDPTSPNANPDSSATLPAV